MRLSIVLAALTGQLETDMKRAEGIVKKRSKQMEQEAEKAGSNIGAALGAGIVLALGAATVAIQNSLKRMDDLGKAAQKIGTTTEALSALSYAATLSDVSFEKLQSSLGRLTRAQQKVAEGQAEMSGLFNAIGVSATDAEGNIRKADEVFAEIADVFQALPDGAEKSALAMQLFGRSGADLIPLLNGGSVAIRGATKELEDFGGVIDNETAKAAEEFNDQITRMGFAFDGFAAQVTKALLPALRSIADAFVDISKAASMSLTKEGFIADDFFGKDSGLIAQLYRNRGFEAPGLINTGEGPTLTDVLGGATNRPQEIEFMTFEDTPAQARAKEIEAALKKLREEQEKGAASTRAQAEARRAAADAARAQAERERELSAAVEAEAKVMEDARRKQIEIELELAEAVAREDEARAYALQQGKDLISDLQFELELMKMTNAERATAIQLRGMDAEAVAKYGEEVAALNEQIEANMKVTEQMDGLRQATSNLFEDLISGTVSAKDAFRSFVDDILANITRMIANNFSTSLFGDMGQTGGGSLGGIASSLFSGLFGGRAGGGPVSGGMPYIVGENGPELFIPQATGRIANNAEVRGMGRGGNTINISVEGQVNMKTREQIAADVARVSNRATARSY